MIGQAGFLISLGVGLGAALYQAYQYIADNVDAEKKPDQHSVLPRGTSSVVRANESNRNPSHHLNIKAEPVVRSVGREPTRERNDLLSINKQPFSANAVSISTKSGVSYVPVAASKQQNAANTYQGSYYSSSVDAHLVSGAFVNQRLHNSSSSNRTSSPVPYRKDRSAIHEENNNQRPQVGTESPFSETTHSPIKRVTPTPAFDPFGSFEDTLSTARSSAQLSSAKRDQDFTKTVLSWTLADLSKPLSLEHNQPLPIRYSSARKYYSGFLPLILEEARASLQSELESKNLKTVDLRFIAFQNSRNRKSDDPWVLSFEISGRAEPAYMLPYDVFILEPIGSSARLMSIAMYSKDNNRMLLKTVPTSNTHLPFREKDEWKATALGSVLTHSRMYQLCMDEPEISLLEQIYQGQLVDKLKNDRQPILSNSRLNILQGEVIQKFIGLAEGVQIVQGPPGTGKTTLIVTLLKHLTHEGKTLVCAPSNKAVQVLAKRFVQEHPKVPVVLLGNKERISEKELELNDIFIDTWVALKIKSLLDMKQRLANANRETHSNTRHEIQAVERDYYRLLEKMSQFQLNYLAQTQKDAGKRSEITAEALLDSLDHLALYFEKNNGTLDKKLLNNANIIFATLGTTGRRLFSGDLKGPINALIVDEAGQSLEAETLIPFRLNPRKCMLIGDTKQLPPTVLSQKALALNFARSLMWRLLEDCQQPHQILGIQYRMDPSISEWPSRKYYENNLLNDRSVLNRGYALSFLGPYAFINVWGQEALREASYSNPQEAVFAEKIIRFLSQRHRVNVETQVGVITFYSGQVEVFRQKKIKAQTVDGFQGDEKDVIIISFVRSNARGNIGFVQDFRRLNVALTRAKHALIMLGNARTLESSDKDVSILINNAKERGCFFDENDVNRRLGPEKKQYRVVEAKQHQKAEKSDASTTKPMLTDYHRKRHQKQNRAVVLDEALNSEALEPKKVGRNRHQYKPKSALLA